MNTEEVCKGINNIDWDLYDCWILFETDYGLEWDSEYENMKEIARIQVVDGLRKLEEPTINAINVTKQSDS
jgi:hypothetical protein